MPQFAIERLFAATKDKAPIITTEVGQHQMWAAQHFHFDDPNKWLTSGGLGTMGYGLPAAIGAQMGNPDMCTPIAHALAWPKRIKTHVPALDLFVTQQLDFQEPDTTRFPALKLARQAMQSGGLAPTILNAANEIAVAAFLNNHIGFTEISQVVEHTLNQVETGAAESIELILQVDQLARSTAEKIVMNHGS